MSRRVALGIDAGGTKIAAGLVADDGEILSSHSVPTPQTDSAGAMEAVRTAAEAVVPDGSSHEILGVGIGLPGLVDSSRGRFLYGPHFPARDIDVARALERSLGLPCVLENDATAAAWGERIYGAGEGADAMIFFTLGTGIGGGVILDGRLVRGGHGFAGEFGHMTIDHTLGFECACGSRGCWETVASGSALDRLAADLMGRNPERYRAYLDDRGPSGYIFEPALADGDTAAREAFDEFASWVSIGVQNLIQVLDPEVIVVGGGVSAMGETLLEPVRVRLREQMCGAGHRPAVRLRIAALGPRAGMVGAAALVMEPSP